MTCLDDSDPGDEVSQSSDPAGQPNVAPEWYNALPENPDGPDLASVTCASDQLCLAGDNSSDLSIGTAPGFSPGSAVGARCDGTISVLLHLLSQTHGARGVRVRITSIVLGHMRYEVTAGRTVRKALQLGRTEVRRLRTARGQATLEVEVITKAAPSARPAHLILRRAGGHGA